jgi:outer membrane protein OmpA-like peptidoglycan-associated protein
MTKTTRLYGSLLIVFALLTVGTLVSMAEAADCKALEVSIRKERSLIKKKAMIADAIKVCPKDAAIVYQDGYSSERLRKYEDAVRSYKKAISIDPGFAKAYFSIGDIQMLTKNYKEAVNYYQQGLRYQPADGRAKASLKEARTNLGELTGTVASPPPAPAPTPAPAPAPAPTVAASSKKPEPKAAVKPKAAVVYAEAPIMRLQVPFYKKTAALSQEARDVLGVVVGQAMNRKDVSGLGYEIGGHTDNLGDASKNYELSKQRANNVQKYLTAEFGVAPARLKLAYHGQKKPKVSNKNPANQKLNRRVEFTKLN